MDKLVFDVQEEAVTSIPLSEVEVSEEELMEDTIKNYKVKKSKELNDSCSKAITQGFKYQKGDGNEYHFSYDIEAQGNFRDARDAFIDGITAEIEWTVTVDDKYQRIMLNQDDLNSIRLIALEHKDSCIKRYRNDLLPLVEAEIGRASCRERV